MHNGSLTFSVAKARDIKDEIQPLIVENWRDVQAGYPDSKLQPRYDFYYDLEDAGALLIIVARMDGILVGYAIVILTAHPHRSADLVGSIDTVYVLPEFRFAGSAARLLHFAETTLRDQGVYSLTMVARTKLVERWAGIIGYRQVETVWERRL